jgi:hypothetical protein
MHQGGSSLTEKLRYARLKTLTPYIGIYPAKPRVGDSLDDLKANGDLYRLLAGRPSGDGSHRTWHSGLSCGAAFQGPDSEWNQRHIK